MSGASQRLRVRVRYSETDQMGVVYHAHYLTWMDVARTELLRALGHPYEELERSGLLFAVSRAYLRLSGSARYGDVAVVTTRVAEVRSRRVSFAYRIGVEGGGDVATGEVSVVSLDRRRRPQRIPSGLLEELRAAAAGPSAASLADVALA